MNVLYDLCLNISLFCFISNPKGLHPSSNKAFKRFFKFFESLIREHCLRFGSKLFQISAINQHEAKTWTSHLYSIYFWKGATGKHSQNKTKIHRRFGQSTTGFHQGAEQDSAVFIV